MITQADLARTLEREWDDERHLLDNAETIAASLAPELANAGDAEDLADAIADGVRESIVPFEFLNWNRAAANVMRCLKSGGWLG